METPDVTRLDSYGREEVCVENCQNTLPPMLHCTPHHSHYSRCGSRACIYHCLKPSQHELVSQRESRKRLEAQSATAPTCDMSSFRPSQAQPDSAFCASHMICSNHDHRRPAHRAVRCVGASHNGWYFVESLVSGVSGDARLDGHGHPMDIPHVP